MVRQLHLLERLVTQQTHLYRQHYGTARDTLAASSTSTEGISAGPEDTGIRIARPPEGFQSLREILRYLHQQDEPSRIIALRRVQRLGLEAAERLRVHFQSWGRVDDVLTHPAHIGPSGECMRLGDLAFVLMASAADAQRFLDTHAETSLISGAPISVSPFLARPRDPA